MTEEKGRDWGSGETNKKEFPRENRSSMSCVSLSLGNGDLLHWTFRDALRVRTVHEPSLHSSVHDRGPGRSEGSLLVSLPTSSQRWGFVRTGRSLQREDGGKTTPPTLP